MTDGTCGEVERFYQTTKKWLAAATDIAGADSDRCSLG
jgi:hypothetical protein